MRKLYTQWMLNWETRLTERDTNRIVRPLEWGLEWAARWPGVGAVPSDPAEFEPFLVELNRRLVERSDEFFGYRTPTDFRLERRRPEQFRTSPLAPVQEETGEAEFLRFTSAVRTPYPENDLANARWFPAKKRDDRAVVVLPHWNSDAFSHNALCRVMNRFGVSALRLSKPYHDIRKPAETERADYAVSANICRTMDAVRQGVIDIRSCLDWLEQQGYRRFAVLGTSLGSCYAFLASAHDERLRLNVFNHASTYFADVVWTGQSTRHIRAGIEPVLTQDQLRNVWLAISPMSYFHRFERMEKKALVIYAAHDLTFLPEFSRQVVHEFRRRKVEIKVVEMPCGHYTIGEAPFKFLDGWHMGKFLCTDW